MKKGAFMREEILDFAFEVIIKVCETDALTNEETKPFLQILSGIYKELLTEEEFYFLTSEIALDVAKRLEATAKKKGGAKCREKE